MRELVMTDHAIFSVKTMKDKEGITPHAKDIIGENLSISGTKIVLDKKATKSRRIFWLLLMTSMFGVMVWQMIDRFEHYFSDPVAVNIEVIYEKYVRFPVILMCNINTATISGFYTYAKPIVPNVFQYGKEYFDTIPALDKLHSDIERNKTIVKFYEKFKSVIPFYKRQSWDSTLEWMEAVGHKLTKMLKSCEWQNEPCSEKNFTMVPYGHSLTQCYAFNADQSKPLYTKLPGFYGGLKMTLDIQQYQYLSSEIKGAGLFMAVLDDIQQSEAISDIASQVSAGMSVSMGLTRINYSDVAPPVGKCNETQGFLGCMRDCRSRYILGKCGCRMPWMSKNMDEKVPSCTFMDKITCTDPKLYAFPTSREVDVYCQCSPKCRRTQYDIKTTTSQISKHEADSYLLQTPPDPDIPKIGRIQDLSAIEMRNSNLSSEMHILVNILELGLRHLDDLSGDIVILSEFLSGQNCTDVEGLMNLSADARELHLKHSSLIKLIDNSFFHVYGQKEEETLKDTPDDLYIRCANDILRHNASHMKQLYSHLAIKIEGILSLTDQVQNITEQFTTKNGDIKFCTESNSTRNITSRLLKLSDIHNIEKEYSLIRENFSKVYERYIQLNNIVQTDEELLNTHDWGKFKNAEFYQQNYVELNIYFESLSTTRISQFGTDSVTSLICDLGGNIGLWLGGSILTLFEILDLIIVIPKLKW